MSTSIVRINNYLVDFIRSEIEVESNIVNIEPKLLAVLSELYNAKGEIVSQSSLMENVWTDVIVSPNTLQRCITQLRKLLGDDAKQQIVIKTHPKLGYSFNLDSLAEKKITSSVFTSSQYRKPAIFVMLLMLIVISYFAAFSNTSTLPTLNEIKPLTTNGQSVDELTLSHSGKFAILVRQTQDAQQLVYKELTSQKELILIKSLRVKGSVAISPDDKTIAFGLQMQNDGKKCVTLVTFDLINHLTKTLTPCPGRFQYSPQWIDNQSLLYLSSSIDRSSDIYLFDVEKQTSKRLTLDNQNTQYLSYQVKTKKLAWINGEGNLTTALLNFPNANLTEIEQSKLPTALQTAEKLSWYDNKTIVIPNKKMIYWFDEHELVKQQSIMTNSTLINLVPTTVPGKFISLFSQKNTSVRRRILNNSDVNDVDISPSVFSEFSGQYQPETNDIALISNKSGNRQLWLASNQEDKQLTKTSKDIDQFIWLNKQQIIYLSEQALWLFTLGESPVKIVTNFLPVRLYQTEGEQLLLSAIVNNEAKLLWFNIRNQQFETLQTGNVYWAQKVSDDIFISSGGVGKLNKYQDGQLGHISALPPLTIQYRYLWREGYLYFQDKKLNIWRYDPINEAAEIIAKYDINSLFLTDFNPENNSIITDNFVSEQRDVVWLFE